ncbi:MAG: hypothetical protein OXI86_14970 [Candidatus Poribacteria bacterium]|nr:hypothetical protein [Candidatus Poribacteria bacterium]
MNGIRYRAEVKRKRLIEVVGFAIFVTALYLMGHAILSQLSRPHPAVVLRVINVFMMLGVFVLAKDAMEKTLKLFYEAPETSLHLSLPLSPMTICGFKLIELIAANLLGIVVWLIPPWIAFGHFFQLPWHFYLALIPACFCLYIIVVCQVTMGMMVITRYFSSGGLIRVLKILGVLIGMSAGFLLSASFLALDRADQITQFLLNRFNTPASSWYPHAWAANLLTGWLPGADLKPWRWGGLLLGGTIVLPILAALLASKIYARSWECAKHVEVMPKRRTDGSGRFSPFGRGRLRSMMAKDFLVFVKHRGWLIMCIMLTLNLLALLVFYTHQLKNVSHYQRFIELLHTFQTVAMFYPVMMTLGLTWAGFKNEGKTWWLLKSTPTTSNLLFHSRLLIATMCATIYADVWMLFGLLLFEAPVGLWLPTLAATSLVTATATAFNTALGALPWVSEIGTGSGVAEKKPVLRIATMAGGIIANVTVVVTSATTTKFVILALVWVVSYFTGRGFVKRLVAK